MSFYAVQVGRSPGVYRSWDDCSMQVHKYPKAVYKKFSTMSEAKMFLEHPRYSYKASTKVPSSLRGASYHTSTSEYLPSASTIPFACSGASKFAEPIPKPKPVKKQVIPDPPPAPGCEEYVYTDGSCLSNGITADAKAGVGVYWREESEYNISNKLDNGVQTNARAELVAIKTALEQGIHKGIRSLEVRSDSKYAIKSCSIWLKKWYNNGWKLSSKDDVCHQDVLIEIKQLINRYDEVRWTHVPAHKGYFGNEMADKLAKHGAQN
ncbi:Ribonuclease H1-like [Oopsacas minuta]|uniref:Ribonuclease H1 n=1 Tax=Oopsacas minuta TaxID=111878 RepID=A0AAV7JUN2_9METZ|nr:Ribonuclease H1-like [Oopsacas minuta]